MKKILLTVTALACSAVCLFTACNSSGKSTLLASPATPVRLETINYDAEELNTFIDKVDLFASEFAAEAYSEYEKGGNFTVSPISLFMALSLAAECADGSTRDEILSAMGVTYDQLITNLSTLYCSLNSEHYVETQQGEKLQSKLSLGNSIWIQEGAQAKQACLNTLSQKYYCYSYSADFLNDNNNANKAVRAFVKDQTNGLIDQDFNLSEDTLFALINTLYLKDVWNTYGDDLSKTSTEYSFTNYDGSVEQLNLLQGYYKDGRAYESETYTSFYTSTLSGYKIKFIVPKDGYTVDEVFTAENISEANSVTDYDPYDNENLLYYHTRCLFPEYEASYDNFLKDLLRNKFGITSLFNGNCNFKNLSDEEIICSDVRHVTKLKVNKTGVEGAAVTIIAADAAAGAPDEREYRDVFTDFIVDRAFGFVLTDKNDVTLFSGVVSNV